MTDAAPTSPAPAPASAVVFPPLLAAIAGWLVPGLGHLLVRKWGRAVLLFSAVTTLAAAGVLLRGHIFTRQNDDLFGLLGFLADAGTGVFYFIARAIENGGPDVSRAAGDYGTRFFATAGVLNLLCALDAHQIAAGKKD